jgi:hypothetical protein
MRGGFPAPYTYAAKKRRSTLALVAACVALPLMTIAQDQKAPPRKFELKAESEEVWKVFDRAAKLKKFAGEETGDRHLGGMGG